MIKLLELGLDFNHLYILQNLNNLPSHIKITGWANFLEQKGYTLGGQLTEEGLKILELVGGNILEEKPKEAKKAIGFSEWCKDLHGQLQQVLLEKTGKKHKTLYGNKSFLCGPKDLETKLRTVINKHKITDYPKIVKVLKEYINKCAVIDFAYVQLIQYYIEKSGVSAFISDYENWEEPEEIKPIPKKEDLF